MGTSRKYRQQWGDLNLTDAVAKLHELADRVERDALEVDGEPIPLEMLKKVKLALRPQGDRFTVIHKLKAHGPQAVEATSGPDSASNVAGPAQTPVASPPPEAGDLAWKPLKRRMKEQYRTLFGTFRQGLLPTVETVTWLRDASARQHALRGHEDPAFARFVEIAEALVDAVTAADFDRAQATWTELCSQHRACHRRRK